MHSLCAGYILLVFRETTLKQQQRKMKMKLTKLEAIAEAKTYGIDIATADERTLSHSDRTYLYELANRSSFRKSKTSPYSLGTAFFINLKKYI